MSLPRGSSSFIGSVPELYDRHLGPTFFDPPAKDLAARIDPSGMPLLELASGTGRLTAPLLERVAPSTIVALDLNTGMQRVAQARLGGRARFVTGNAMALPFADGSFAQAVCQFGVMFFPDKAAAAAEVRRVLKRGGTFVFSTWAALADNPVSAIAHRVIGSFFAVDPPMFMLVPFGYADVDRIGADMRAGGFTSVDIETIALDGPSSSAEHVAIGLVKGSPMALAIQERASTPMDAIVEAVAAELRHTFGAGPFTAPMRAHVVRAS